MATALGIQSHRDSGILGHNLRHEPGYQDFAEVKNVFPEDTSRNRTLFHDQFLIKKVDEMTHQPAPPGKEVGRAIQCNARRFVGVNFWVDQSLLSPITNPDGTPKNFPVQCRDKNGQYLYSEGKPVMREMTRQQFKSEDDRRRFENLCVEFSQNRMGGQLASLTTHVDERTPHVQGLIAPLDDDGKLTYHKFYGRPAQLKQLQREWAEALEQEFGITKATREEIEARQATNKTHEEFVHAQGIASVIKERDQMMESAKVSHTLPEPRRMESAKKYRDRIAPVFDRLNEANHRLKLNHDRLESQNKRFKKEQKRLFRQINLLAQKVIDRIPDSFMWVKFTVGTDAFKLPKKDISHQRDRAKDRGLGR